MKPSGGIFAIRIPLRKKCGGGPVLIRKPAPLFVLRRPSPAEQDTGTEDVEDELPPAA